MKIDAATRKSYIETAKMEMARQLIIKNPHLSEEDAKIIVGSTTRKMEHLEAMLRQRNRAQWLSALSDSGKAGVAGGVLAGAVDVVVQMYLTGQVDWDQVGRIVLLGASSAALSGLAHHLIVGKAINNAVVHQFFIRAANAVGLPTGLVAAKFVSQLAGGLIGGAVFPLGMYAFGMVESRDAARMALAGTIGPAIGTATGGAILSFATVYGTAGTGAAISSLSGAAAKSAALAWLGGGTVASGGGGVALGSSIVFGGAAIVGIAASAAIYYGIKANDNNKANHRFQYNANNLLCSKDMLEELCRRKWRFKSRSMQ